MENFSDKLGLSLVQAMIQSIQDNAQYLSDIDGEIGDGDHGINMNKGFSLCQKRLQGGETLSEGLELLGTILFTEIGGSMGPLYGNFFLEMAGCCKEQIDAEGFSAMLHAGRAAILELGEAKIGDKTLIDTLSPAIEAFDQTYKNKDFTVGLDAMSEAAERGKEATKNLEARLGRASRLGERSRGHLDAGATSCCLLLQAMAREAKRLLAH